MDYGIYTIRSVSNLDQYVFPADDGSRKYGNDFDVRSHTNDEKRNQWNIRSDGNGGFYIVTTTNPENFLFAANDGTNGYGKDFDVRTHTNHETRNVWLIDGFTLHQKL